MINEVEKKLRSPKKNKIPKTFSLSADVWERLQKYCHKEKPPLCASNVVDTVLHFYLVNRGFK